MVPNITKSFLLLNLVMVQLLGSTFGFRSSRMRREIEPNGITAKQELKDIEEHKDEYERYKNDVLTYLRNIPNPRETALFQKDIVLTKFFSQVGFEVQTAVQLANKVIQWRQEQGIASILDEDFSESLHAFEAHTSGVDVNGRPIVYLHFGAWSVKDALEAGRQDKYQRTIYYLVEQGMQKALVNYEEKGNENARFDLIINVAKSTGEGDGCPECIAFISNIIVNIDNNWPNWIHKLVFINATPLFDKFLGIIAPLLSEKLNKNIVKVGSGSVNNELSKLIDQKELDNLIK